MYLRQHRQRSPYRDLLVIFVLFHVGALYVRAIPRGEATTTTTVSDLFSTIGRPIKQPKGSLAFIDISSGRRVRPWPTGWMSTSTSSSSSPSSLYMGMKVNIRIVGRKSSEPWLEEGCAMYETRLLPSNIQVETTWHKDNPSLIKGVEGDRTKGHSIVLLDPLGVTKTSERLSEDLYQWLDQGGSRLSFVIGGAEGLPSELKYPSSSSSYGASKQGTTPPTHTMISLSSLTFTHQFARMLLMEQIYRATEIRKGSGYHK